VEKRCSFEAEGRAVLVSLLVAARDQQAALRSFASESLSWNSQDTSLDLANILLAASCCKEALDQACFEI
jgi:hypothetical protein